MDKNILLQNGWIPCGMWVAIIAASYFVAKFSRKKVIPRGNDNKKLSGKLEDELTKRTSQRAEIPVESESNSDLGMARNCNSQSFKELHTSRVQTEKSGTDE